MNALVEQPVTVLLRTAVDVAQSWGSYGWILGLLLIAALTAKELLRAYGWPQTDRRMRALNIQRQKQMISDSDKLLKLAKELNAEVSASNEGFLTVEQLRQLVQIEKLARNVREEMIDTVNQPTTILPHPPLMPPYR